MRTIIPVRLLFGLLACAALLVPPAHGAAPPLHVLASTFPIYQFTRNITRDVPGIEVELMIPAALGCPHDYALTPQDMSKLARADVLVINGLGMEEFLGAPVARANSRLRLIDSSRGIGQLLAYADEEDDHEKEAGHAHHHGHNHDHGTNPHLFASPRMAALVVANIARDLAGIRPEAAAQLTANGRAYSDRLNRLADEMAELGRKLSNKRIVSQHGVFDYLARDMGLMVVAVVQEHGGQDPSAAEMRRLIAAIRTQKAGALFTEPQYPDAMGKTIARETGIPAASLDPGANGPDQAPLTWYEQIMRANMQTLDKTLGSH